MGLKDDIKKKVKEIMDTKFETEDVTCVPDIEDSRLTFGNKGLKFTATVLYIDLRGSTELLNKHNKTTLAKIHMAYFHTIVSLADSLGGEVRSFNGDSMLVFFQGTTKEKLSKAVKAAMQMKYLLSVEASEVSPLINSYSKIEFGIGIDHDDILCTKIGKGKDSNNRDLIWISNGVNKAVKISDTRSGSYSIGISSYVYDNLLDEVKFHTEKDSFGIERKINMWTQNSFTYNNETHYYYTTSYHWTV